MAENGEGAPNQDPTTLEEAEELLRGMIDDIKGSQLSVENNGLIFPTKSAESRQRPPRFRKPQK